MSKRVALLDIDGTLCPSLPDTVYQKMREHTTPGKIVRRNTIHFPSLALIDDPHIIFDHVFNLELYPWVWEWDWNQYELYRICTARMGEWNEITWDMLDRIPQLYGLKEKAYKHNRHDCGNIANIRWDGDYVRKKTLKLLELIARYNYEGYHVDVFEDDKSVLKRVGWHHHRPMDFTRFVVEDGKLDRMDLKYFLRE